MSLKCIVCGEPLPPGTLNSCSDCKLPCHTKCANRRKNALCDRCRAAKQAQKTKKPTSLNGSERATVTTRSSANLTPNSSGDVRRGRTPAPTSAVKQTRASGSSPPLAALPPKALSAETRRPPLLNSPLGETLDGAQGA